jgi:hypothetical protein
MVGAIELLEGLQLATRDAADQPRVGKIDERQPRVIRRGGISGAALHGSIVVAGVQFTLLLARAGRLAVTGHHRLARPTLAPSA